MLKRLPDSAQSTLLRVFNDLWQSGDFLKSWSNATIIPIPKPGKDSTSSNNYRPITLTGGVCKTFERMVTERLVWYLESNNILTNYQSGFRKEQSTYIYLSSLKQNSWVLFSTENSPSLPTSNTARTDARTP